MNLQFIFIAMLFLLSACDPSNDNATPTQAHLPAPQAKVLVPTSADDPRAPLPPFHPEPIIDPNDWKMTIIERIPFGSTHSSSDEITTFNKGIADLSANDAMRSMRKLMASRTPEGMQVMMRLLSEYEQKIPTTLPSQSELDALEMSVTGGSIVLPLNHWMVSFGKAVELASALVRYGVPEATTRAESFRKSLHEKWDQFPQAKLYLKSLDMEMKHAYADVEAGIMPWQERKFTKIEK